MVILKGLNTKSTILIQKTTLDKFYSYPNSESSYNPKRWFFYKKDLTNCHMVNSQTWDLKKAEKIGLWTPSDYLISKGVTNINELEENIVFEDSFKIIEFNIREHRVSLKSLSTNELIEMSLSDFWPFIIENDVVKGEFKGIFTFVQKWWVLQIQPYNN